MAGHQDEINRLVFFEGTKFAFDLEDLLRASSYKAVLEDAMMVVVKRLKDVAAGKEFEQQMEVVGSIKDENVVDLWAYSYSKDEKLMVFDYFSQGSVASLLHGMLLFLSDGGTKVLDTTGVQTYVINSARVLFLNKRPQPRASTKAATSSYTCEICARSLLDPFRFCSLGCKLVGIKRNGDASFVLKGGGENDEEASVSGRAEEDDIKRLADHRGGSHEGPRHDIGLPKPSSSSSSFPASRRRKGNPHRAPFGS